MSGKHHPGRDDFTQDSTLFKKYMGRDKKSELETQSSTQGNVSLKTLESEEVERYIKVEDVVYRNLEERLPLLREHRQEIGFYSLSLA